MCFMANEYIKGGNPILNHAFHTYKTESNRGFETPMPSFLQMKIIWTVLFFPSLFTDL